MKKKLLSTILLICMILTSCGSADLPTQSSGVNSENKNNSNSESTKNDSENNIASSDSSNVNNTEESSKEDKDSEVKEYYLGDTWTVDGQWSLTINSIQETESRNQYSEKNPAQVFIIDFVYENIGYQDANGIMDGLYFDLEMEQIIDSDGFMGYSYPGEITDYAQETPVGAKCKGQACIGVDNESSEIKIIISKYDGSRTEQKATFVLSI